MDLCVQQNRYLYNTFSEQFELQFYKKFHALKNLGCDYLYFLGSNSGNTHRFCTHESWIDFYYDEQFVLNDPLKRIAEKTNFIALPWSQITHSSKGDKKAIEGRKSFGLHNGLTITREQNQRKYIFALSTEENSHDLARYLLLEKNELLQKFILDCMKLFDQYMLMTDFYFTDNAYVA